MSVLNATAGSRANGAPAPAFYRYRGSLADKPPRRTPGPRPSSLSSRVLAVLAELGGEASTTEVRCALETSGVPAAEARQAGTALNRLAAMRPPRAVRTGDGRGGHGRAQRWRMTGPVAPVPDGRGTAPGSGHARSTWNARRVVDAGTRDAEVLAAALEAFGDLLGERHRQVARARVASPGLSWSELAASLGMTKDAARACCRRVMRRAGHLKAAGVAE